MIGNPRECDNCGAVHATLLSTAAGRVVLAYSRRCERFQDERWLLTQLLEDTSPETKVIWPARQTWQLLCAAALQLQSKAVVVPE
jgi:hypothetical protein